MNLGWQAYREHQGTPQCRVHARCAQEEQSREKRDKSRESTRTERERKKRRKERRERREREKKEEKGERERKKRRRGEGQEEREDKAYVSLRNAKPMTSVLQLSPPVLGSGESPLSGTRGKGVPQSRIT